MAFKTAAAKKRERNLVHSAASCKTSQKKTVVALRFSVVIDKCVANTHTLSSWKYPKSQSFCFSQRLHILCLYLVVSQKNWKKNDINWSGFLANHWRKRRDRTKRSVTFSVQGDMKEMRPSKIDIFSFWSVSTFWSQSFLVTPYIKLVTGETGSWNLHVNFRRDAADAFILVLFTTYSVANLFFQREGHSI